MRYDMKLDASAFERVKSGVKSIEVRLNDSKRQKLVVGDEILFSNLSDVDSKVIVQVVKLDRFDSFEELLNTYGLECYGLQGKMTENEFIDRVFDVYTHEQETEFGALAIFIELVV